MEDTVQTVAIVVLAVWVICLHIKLSSHDHPYKDPPRY